MLPDDVLLAAFDFYVDEATKVIWDVSLPKHLVEGWQPLIHVCRRWRTVVFGSPHRFNLGLGCSFRTPARDKLDIWPALPLFIFDNRREQRDSADDVTAILRRSDRVRQIRLDDLSGWHLEKVLQAMQVPFPELTHLELHSLEPRFVPNTVTLFNGSVPHLRVLRLQGIPFPGLPGLLLSATHLVDLNLRLPRSAYISPEVMVTLLSTLTSLRFLSLGFESRLSRPERASRRPPPSTRSVLPALTHFSFNGVGEYLEDIVARIDIPLINRLSISFFDRIEFDTRSISYINHIPTFKVFKVARLFFADDGAAVELYSQPGVLTVNMPCRLLNRKISSMGQVCTSCLPSLSTLGDLYISQRQDSRLILPYIHRALWLGLLRPFSSVKNLYLSRDVAPSIVPALQDIVGGRMTEVLPTLHNITLLQPSGPVRGGIEQFVATQVAGHPIEISHQESPLPPLLTSLMDVI